KQSIQTGSGSGNRQIIPLSLSFDAQMRLRFLKGHFQSPATDEPGQNLQWRVRQFGRQQCLWLKLSLRVADQHPSYDYARVVRSTPPQRRFGADFNGPFALAIPVFDLQFRPNRLGIGQHILQGWSPIAFDAWPTSLSRPTSGRRIKEGSIQPQSRN